MSNLAYSETGKSVMQLTVNIFQAENPFDVGSIIPIAWPVAHLLVVAACLLLVWTAVFRARAQWGMVLLFVLVGAGLLFYNALTFRFGGLGWSSTQLLFPLSQTMLHLTSGAFILLLGVVNVGRALFGWRGIR